MKISLSIKNIKLLPSSKEYAIVIHSVMKLFSICPVKFKAYAFANDADIDLETKQVGVRVF